MRKALIVGVGGTGISVIQRVQELIEWRHNVRASDVQFVRYLGVDTSTDMMREEGRDSLHARVPPDGVTKILRLHQEGQWQWVDPAIVGAAGAIEDGAGAIRMIGKFAFLYPDNFRRFRAMLNTRVRELLPLTVADIPDAFGGERAFDNKVKVFVIANTVSGTGSGAFVDVGYVVRQFVDGPVSSGVKFETTALITLPDRLDDLHHAANAYQCLKELNHWMGEHEGYHIDDPLSPGNRITVPRNRRPFDYCYLVSRHRGMPMDPVDNHEYLEDLIGEFIYQDIFLPLAQERDGRRDDYKQFFVSPDALGYYPRFSSFGLATIEYPVVQIARGCSYRWLVEMINAWLNLSGSDSSGGVRAWASASYRPVAPPVDSTPYTRLLQDASIAEGSLRQDGSLLRALAAPADLGGGSETSDIVSSYEKIISSAVTSYRGEVADLDAAESRIERGFQKGRYQPGSDRGPFPVGVVDFTIAVNDDRLRKELPGILTKQCVDLTFGVGGQTPGPHYALTYLQRVEERRKAIEAGKGGIEDPSVLVSLRGELDAAKQELREIESDFVLWSPADSFRTIARHEALRRYRQAAISYFDALLTSRLIEAGQRLGKDLYPHVQTLNTRVGNLRQYILDGMRAHFTNLYLRAIAARTVNGYDFLQGNPEAEITREYERLEPELGREQRLLTSVRELSDRSLAKQLGQSVATPGAFDGEMGRLRNPNPHEGELPYRISRDHEDSMVGPVRERFLKSLGHVPLLDRFMQHSGEAQDLRHVHTLAGAFINADDSDQHMYYDEDRMYKRWFAYPGGDQMATSGPPDHAEEGNSLQEFACLLRDAVGDVKWPDESVNIDTPQMAVFLVERGAIPMRFLGELNTEMRDAAARVYRPLDDEGLPARNPLASRKDIVFMPLDIKDRDRLRNARALFVAAVAAKQLVVEPSVGRFRLAGARAGSYGSPIMDLPRSPDLAALQLYGDERLQKELAQRVHRYRDASPVDFVNDLARMRENRSEWGLDVPDGDPAQRMARVIHGYVQRDDGLLATWKELNLEPDLTMPASDAEYVAVADSHLEGGRHPRVGFYCRSCRAWLGDRRDSYGNPDPRAVPQCYSASH